MNQEKEEEEPQGAEEDSYSQEDFEEDSDWQEAIATNLTLKKKLLAAQQQSARKMRPKNLVRSVLVVAPSAITRRKREAKISMENRHIASRLEHGGGGAVRSSGYGRSQAKGPLAKRNMLLARTTRKAPALRQPDMSF